MKQQLTIRNILFNTTLLSGHLCPKQSHRFFVGVDFFKDVISRFKLVFSSNGGEIFAAFTALYEGFTKLCFTFHICC